MKHNLSIALALSILFPAASQAISVEDRGREIAIEIDRRDQGWGDQQATTHMILRNRQGQESKRMTRSLSLEVEGDGDKALILFDFPKDIKGTALLSFTHPVTADDQWLYLPALKRVKRISSSNKSGPFMGSEFAFEDITSQEVEKFSYKYLRDEEIEGRNVFVIERYPLYENSGYVRQIVWVDKLMYQPIKTEFYDRKNSLLKTLTQSEYSQYLSQYWRPNRMEMVNHQNGKSTTLHWGNYQLRTGLSERDFDKSRLKRSR